MKEEEKRLKEEAEAKLKADQEEKERMEKIVHNELKGIHCRFRGFKVVFYTVGGQGADGTLIYIALSKCKNESITHLRK